MQARARAGSEASELRAALDAVGKEKAAISEQLAVLKTQLCFVLQVSPLLYCILHMHTCTSPRLPTAACCCWWSCTMHHCPLPGLPSMYVQALVNTRMYSL
jgi:hypothetical protein